MRIPLANVPVPDGAQRTFTPLDTTVFDKVGQAGRNIGQAVEGIGEEGINLGLRIKGAIDQGAISKAETQAEVHFQGFADSLRDGKNVQNNDPSTYLPRWKDQQAVLTTTLQQDSAVKSLGPVAKKQYEAMMAKWTAMTTQQVGHLATEKALQNGIGDVNTAYETKLLIGDTAGAKQTIERGMAVGLINPIEGKQKIFEIPMKSEYNQAVQMMTQSPDTGGGPIVLEKALAEQNSDGSFKFYPHVVGQHRETLMFDAFRNARMLQSQTAQEYAVQAAQGQQADPNQVNKDLALGKITPAQAKSLLKPAKVFTAANFAQAVTVISDYDPKSDPTHEKESQIWASLNEAHEHLSPEANARLNALFKDKLREESKLNTEVARGAHQIIDENFRLGVYGKYEIKHQDKEGNWATVTNPTVLKQAQVQRARAETQLNDWLNKPENANATPEEAAIFLNGVNRAQRRGALWGPVINPVTGKANP